MKKFRWIEICFLLTALPQFTEAATKTSLTATYGEDVTFPCENSRKPRNNCKDTTTWTFAASGRGTSVELITEGKISEDVGAKKNRLRLTEDCSLVINHVQEEDAGRYDCRQYIPGRHNPESYFLLSVSAGEKTGPTTTEPTTAERVTTAEINTTSTTHEAPTKLTNNGSARLLDVVMLTLRVFEVLLLTVITVLLFRAQVKRGSSAEFDGEQYTVNYENVGESSASVRFHRSSS